MAYENFKDLPKRNKVVDIAKSPKYDGYKRGITSMVYKFFDKKTLGGPFKNKIMSNQQLEKELHKPNIRKLERRKVHSSFIDNIWGADLADLLLLSKFNKGIHFLL